MLTKTLIGILINKSKNKDRDIIISDNIKQLLYLLYLGKYHFIESFTNRKKLHTLLLNGLYSKYPMDWLWHHSWIYIYKYQILFPPFLIYGNINLIRCSIETSRLKSTSTIYRQYGYCTFVNYMYRRTVKLLIVIFVSVFIILNS